MKDLEAILKLPNAEAAKALLGMELIHTDGATTVGGVIVETEAYHQSDPASHTFRGKSRRNATMYEPAGALYVYFSYGIHWCMNVVTGSAGEGEGVLIRALEPTRGIETAMQRRKTTDLHRLMRGPACVTQALGINGKHDGLKINQGQVKIVPHNVPKEISSGPRIGISKATDLPLRFWITNNPFVSVRGGIMK